MTVGNIKNLREIPLENDLVKHASMKVLISEHEGWDDYVMRVFELGKNGYSPKHSHPWPHINYIISGQGELMINGEQFPISSGSYAYVPHNELHQFRNTGESILQFICIVPKEGHK